MLSLTTIVLDASTLKWENHRIEKPNLMKSLFTRKSLYIQCVRRYGFLFVLSCLLLGFSPSLYGFELNSGQNDTKLDQIRLASQVQATGTPSVTTITSGTTDGGVDRAKARSLDDIAQFSSPFKRTLELHILLLDASEEQVLKLLAEADGVEVRKRLLVQKPILQRLAQLNPKKAYAQIKLLEGTDHSQLIYSVFMEWSSYDLEEAVEFASSLDDNERIEALNGILTERSDLSEEEHRLIARKLDYEQFAINLIMQEKLSKPIDDPEEVWNELVEEVQDNPGQFWMLATVARAWVEKDGMGILDEVSETISNAETLQFVLNSVLGLVTENDPDRALEYALKLDNNPTGLYSLVLAVARSWVKFDPQSALNAVSEIERTSLRNRLEDSVVREWAYAKPREVLSLIDTFSENLHRTATTAAVSSLVQKDPQEAAEFVASMSGSSRASAANSLLMSWTRGSDHESAIDWVLNEPQISDLKPLLLPDALSNLVSVDPQLAMQKALDQPISEDQLGLEVTVIGHLSYQDPDEARDLLSKVRTGRTQIVAYQEVGKSFVRNGDTEKALNLAEELPSSKRAEYFEPILKTWTQYDHEELLKSIDRLPTVEIQSKAALMLLANNERNTNLSKEDEKRVRQFLSVEDEEILEDGDVDLR